MLGIESKWLVYLVKFTVAIYVLVIGLLLTLTMIGMVVVFGEQFGVWEFGWVSDPNDDSCGVNSAMEGC